MLLGFISYDWEIYNMQCFLSRLQDKVVVKRGEDKVHQLNTKSGPSLLNLFTLPLKQ